MRRQRQRRGLARGKGSVPVLGRGKGSVPALGRGNQSENSRMVQVAVSVLRAVAVPAVGNVFYRRFSYIRGKMNSKAEANIQDLLILKNI